MDVSVILVNYNTLELLCNTIDSVFSHTSLINYEIIVVDNNSSDNPADTLKNKYGSKIKFLPLPENIGFGRANNEGVRISGGRNLFFLNPDTILISNAIKLLSDYLDNHHDVGIAGGNIFNKEMGPAYSFRHFQPSLCWELNDLLFSLPEKWRYGKNMHFNHTLNPVRVGYITGADLMISRSVFEEADLFSSEFFLYFEETDLAFKVKKLGLRVMNIPDAKIIHLEGESFNVESDRTRHYLKGKLIFYQKNYPKYILLILNFIFWLTIQSRIIILTLTFNRSKVKRWNTQAHIFRVLKIEMKVSKD